MTESNLITVAQLRERMRSRRVRDVRATTISCKRMTKKELEAGRLLYPEEHVDRPRTRGDCENGIRPCPFVACKYNLFIDVSPTTGSIKLNFPDLEVADMGESCALDVAERGGATLEEVGVILNLTRERARQVEVDAIGKLTESALSGHVDDEERNPSTSRALTLRPAPIETSKSHRLVQMIGRRFGNTTVLARNGATPQGIAVWKLRCDCGAVFLRDGVRLRKSERDGRQAMCRECRSAKRKERS